MTEYQRSKRPLVATDIVIEYNDGIKDGIILITRKNFPPGLALPGGFAECGLNLGQNAQKESREETGLEVVIKDSENPLLILSDPDRDPRAHIISVAYAAKGYGILRAGDDAKTATLYSINEIMGLL